MEGSHADGQEGDEVKSGEKTLTQVELTVDSRPKKLTGIELIKENVKELHEVIAYMDYSFERAFTIQEKQFMLAYKVSSRRFEPGYNCPRLPSNFAVAYRTMLRRFKRTSIHSKSTPIICWSRRPRRTLRS